MGIEELKREAARAALQRVEAGMRLGLGSGTTSRHFVELLGERVRQGLSVVGVPTSEDTHALAAGLGIPLTTLDDTPELDLCIDGADEVGPALALIKGGGGALLREKIVASASRAMLVIVDERKLVDRLGAFPLPVEVVPFGLKATGLAVRRAAERLGLEPVIDLRMRADGHVFVTDGGHHILDCRLGAIDDPAALAAALSVIPGVVEHGLFLGLARAAFVAGSSGVRILEPSA
jgi:ribose 5-phosphate isomerase A